MKNIFKGRKTGGSSDKTSSKDLTTPPDSSGGSGSSLLAATTTTTTTNMTHHHHRQNDVFTWDNDEVVEWLVDVGMPPVVQAVFRDKAIRGSDLLDMSIETFEVCSLSFTPWN